MRRDAKRFWLIFSFSFFVQFFLSFQLSSHAFAQSLFDEKFQEALTELKKGDLLSAYISFSLAYNYVENNSQRYSVKLHLGDILFEWGDTFAAENLYEEAYLISKSTEALKKLVIAKAENLSDDFPKYVKLIPPDEIDSEILYRWGRYVLRKEGNPRKACDLFDSVRGESEYFHKAQYMCGVAMIMIGDREEALRRFETAKESNEPLLKQYSWVAIARIYSDVGRFIDALSYYLRIPSDSPVFYEAKYEVCWVFYALERYDEVIRCIDYFKKAKKTYLSRRIDILDAFVSMKDDLPRSYLTFTMISDSSALLLSQIIEAEKAPLSFWEESYKNYFSAKEPNILDWLEMFPEYRFFRERKDYIAELRDKIKGILDDLGRTGSSSVIVANRSIKKYLERVWLIQDRIYEMISEISYRTSSVEEKKHWYTLYTLFQEVKNIDFKARELATEASIKSAEVAKEKEFKRWEKKYRVYTESMKNLMEEINKITGFHKENSQLVTRMAYILSHNAKDTVDLEEIIKTYENSFNIFLDFSGIWNEIIKSVSKYVMEQEKKLRGMNHVLENFLSYLDRFEVDLMRYMFTVKIKKEVEKTYALAQYGFIESAWAIKEREADILSQLHVMRLEEENKTRDILNQIYKQFKEMAIQKVSGEGSNFFEIHMSESVNMVDDIMEKLDNSMKLMIDLAGFSWEPPAETIQKLIEEKRKKKEEIEQRIREIKKGGK